MKRSFENSSDRFDNIDLMDREEAFSYQDDITFGIGETTYVPYSYFPCLNNQSILNSPSRSRRCMRILSYLPFVLLMVLLLVSTIRIVTIVFETWEMVRGERIAEQNFLMLCAEGHARESPHMQKGCMQASAAGASPLILAVLGRSSASIMHEIWEVMSHPLQSFSIAGVVGVCSFLSWVPWIRALFSSAPTPAMYSNLDDRVVVIHNSTNPALSQPRQRASTRPLLMRSCYSPGKTVAGNTISEFNHRQKSD